MRNLVCKITGKKYIFSQEYFAKKIQEYGDVETLQKYFVVKKAKSFITRGYSCDEIRNILDVNAKDLLSSDSDEIKNCITYHQLKTETNIRKSTSNFAMQKTDPDVLLFIENLKKHDE